jgi:hypothetical protein
MRDAGADWNASSSSITMVDGDNGTDCHGLVVGMIGWIIVMI